MSLELNDLTVVNLSSFSLSLEQNGQFLSVCRQVTWSIRDGYFHITCDVYADSDREYANKLLEENERLWLCLLDKQGNRGVFQIERVGEIGYGDFQAHDVASYVFRVET